MYVLMATIVVSIGIMACRDIQLQQAPSVRLLECPPPPTPVCQPSTWQGEMLDTTTVPPYRDEHYYWRITPVRGATTTAEEYAICFLDGSQAIVTRGARSRQVLVPARRVDVDTLYTTQQSLSLDGYRSLGTLTRSGSTMLAAALPEESRLARIVQLRGILSQSAILSSTVLLEEGQAWISHPALSPDGSFLIVASDRVGGYGGLDLWYAVRTSDGTWDSLRNLGPAVNTPCDELSPFVTKDGTLLFASNGHASVGGYDLFAVQLRHTSSGIAAGTVENLRPPINTAADELFPSTPSNYQELLYWSSNRRDNNFDLYLAQRLERPKAPPPAVTAESDELDTFPRARLRGRIQTPDRRPVEGADVSVRELRRRRLVAQSQTDSSGTFEVAVPTEQELEITAQSGSGFYDVRRLRIPGSDTLVVLNDMTIPDILTLRINFPHDQARVPYEFVLDTNGQQTDRRWTEELDRVAANILRYRDRIKHIVLVGHTDPNGTDAYNLQLGRRRVEFVIEELEKRGVPRSLLKGLSAGERQLLPPRPGEPTDQYYRRCRRVELSKVLQ